MATKSSPARSKAAIRSKAHHTLVSVPRAKGAATRPTEIPIGIDRGDRAAVSDLLRDVLADQHVLSQKTRMCHWNLTSGRFDPLHKMFEEQYQTLATAMDETAERIRMLGHIAPAGLVELARRARLREVVGQSVGGQAAIEMLLADHERVVRNLRDAIEAAEGTHDDIGTADFFIGLLRAHEKTAWMLRSHLTA